MSDEFSTREDIENDLQEDKETLDALTKPVRDQMFEAAKDAIKNEAVEGIAGGASASEVAAAAETMSGAGTVAAASEATATASAAGGAAAAEGATIGAAGGPVGVATGAVIGAALAAAKKIHDESQISLDKDDPDAPKVSILVLFVCALGFMIVFCGTLLSKGISGVFSIGHETEFEQDIVNGNGMAPAGEQYMDGMGDTNLTYNYAYPLKNTINTYIYGKDGTGINDGFRAALHKAIDLHCKNLIEQLDAKSGGINGHPYNAQRSLDSFYSNPYPYDLATATFSPKIGDVLHAPGYSSSYKAKYDDVNFAEVIAILSMSADVEGANFGFDWGSANFEDFMEFTKKEECYQNLYELGLKWVPVYEGDKEVLRDDNTVEYIHIEKDGDEIGVGPFDSADDCKAGAPESVTDDGVELSFTEYYVRVYVKPFGLRELFSMAFGGDPQAAADMMHVNFYEHSNLYMLNYSERVTRLYQRKQKTIIHTTNQGDIEVDSLGPSFRLARSPYSSVYEDVLNDSWLISQNLNGCGRSCWYYIEITYNDKFEQIVWPDDPIGSQPPAGDFIPPESAKILDMFEYVNQGDYPNTLRGSSRETIKQSGCLDCSVAMIAMYYKREHIPVTDVSRYVNSEAQLQTGLALAAFGLRQGSNISTDVINGVISEINEDRPVILHIRGYWTSGSGKELHGTSNGHFLVGMGYDDTGLYVYDPGRRTNYHIDYADWSRVGDLYYRPVYN